MGIFDRFTKKEDQPIEGYIGFYGLVDWWLDEFSEQERQYMVDRFKPLGGTPEELIKGKFTTDHPATQFLNELATWFKSKQDSHLVKRIYKKMEELGTLHPIEMPGYYQGRHYTTYVEKVEELKRSDLLDEAESLLLGLVEAVEAQSKVDGFGLAPYYFEELAVIYRKRKDYSKEITILERYINNMSESNIKPRIIERLEKAKSLENKANQER